jgi:hypothetical protein
MFIRFYVFSRLELLFFFFFDILIPSTKVNMLILKQQQKSDAR